MFTHCSLDQKFLSWPGWATLRLEDKQRGKQGWGNQLLLSVSLKLGQLLVGTPLSSTPANVRRLPRYLGPPAPWWKLASVWVSGLPAGLLRGEGALPCLPSSSALQGLHPACWHGSHGSFQRHGWLWPQQEALEKSFYFSYCSSNIFSFRANKEDF